MNHILLRFFKRFNIVRTSLLSCILMCPLWVFADVKVSVNNSVFEFTNPPRLHEVLAPVAFEQHWYWPASKLYRLNSDHPEQLRQQTINKIETLLIGRTGLMQQQLVFILNEVKQWPLADRVLINIDYDLARINMAYNPRFESGEYLLTLAERPSNVLVSGALTKSFYTAHLGAVPIESYLSAVKLNAYADNKRVWVIQPDGHFYEVILNAWTLQTAQLMPGSILFIPFNTSWFNSDFEELNQLLLSLAVNRIF